MNIYNNAIYSIASAIAHRKAPGLVLSLNLRSISLVLIAILQIWRK